MKIILIGLVLIFSTTSFSQKRKKTKIVYKKRQVIDLGALMIDGELVSPGDFSIEDEKEKATQLLFKRKNYNDRLRVNIEYVF